MTDKEKAVAKVMEFLKDETKRVLLIRGYDNEAKIRVALSCLNQIYDNGIIRTSSMSNISDLINRSFKNNYLPNSAKSTTLYKIGNMSVNISSYASHTKMNPKGNEDTFTLFYPVQTVLDNPKRYAAFKKEIKNCNSGKVILITTNEWGIKEWDIENHVNEVFFYEVENDNPQIMKNLRNNGAIL